jgi:hypothetical protein
MATCTASTKSASFYIVARTIKKTVSLIRMSISTSITCVGGVVDTATNGCKVNGLAIDFDQID